MSMDLKERKPNRWKGFDYSSENAYFVTICVDKQQCLLGKIANRQMVLNEYGKIVEQCWIDLPNHYPNCVLDTFTIMSNHIHGIIVIDNSVFKSADAVGNGFKPFPTKKHGLSEMVRALKTFSSRRSNELLSITNTNGAVGNGFKPFLTNTPPHNDVGNGFKPFPTETLHDNSAGNGFKPFPTETPHDNSAGNGFKPFPTNTPPHNDVGNGFKPFPTETPHDNNAGNGFKPFPTEIRHGNNAGNGFKPFPTTRFKWQKSFHDHIIRDYKALENIRNYINTNPANWEKDVFFSI